MGIEFEILVAGAEASVERARLEYVREQINLCEQLKAAADNLLQEASNNPYLFSDVHKRRAVTQFFLTSYFQKIEHKSHQTFCDEVTAAGFRLHKPLFYHYHYQGNAPASTRMIEFVRAMSNVSDIITDRLRNDHPKLSTLDFDS